MNISTILSRFAFALTLFSLAGCTTLHFDRGEPLRTPAAKSQSSWHHNVLFDLYELSDPVKPAQVCGNTDWASVKVENSLVNNVASSMTNLFGPIWYPQTVTVSCR